MKKILVLLLILFMVFPIFAEPSYQDLKDALATTSALAQKVIDESKAKDVLLAEATTLLNKKDATITELTNKIVSIAEDNNSAIKDLITTISNDEKEIKDLRKIIEEFITKFNNLSKNNSILFSVGFTTKGTFIGNVDYIFPIWRFRFITGVAYETPVTFGIKAGMGISF
jgi:hypothetical protein